MKLTPLQAAISLFKMFNFQLGGSLSLILQGYLKRKANDIDIFVTPEVFDKMFKYFNARFMNIGEYGNGDPHHAQFYFCGIKVDMWDNTLDDQYTPYYIDNVAIPLRRAGKALKAKLLYCQSEGVLSKHKDDITILLAQGIEPL